MSDEHPSKTDFENLRTEFGYAVAKFETQISNLRVQVEDLQNIRIQLLGLLIALLFLNLAIGVYIVSLLNAR